MKIYPLIMYQNLLKSKIFVYNVSFEFENFNNRMLLLKEFQAKYYSAGGSKDSKSSR